MADHDLPVFALTNDDGVGAPGIQALLQAVGGLGRCRVVAPCGPVSGCGHQVTTHGAIRMTRLDQDVVAVSGTPVDCVRLALTALVPQATWVLSGINAGGNLGTDVHISGTVAAAREAAIHGVSAIAVSHYIERGRDVDWSRAAEWTGRVLQRLLAFPCRPGTFWNVNLPHLPARSDEPALVFCPLDPSPLPVTYRIEDDVAVYTGDYHQRIRKPGGDVAVCFDGQISATVMHVADPPDRFPGAPAGG